MVVAMLLLGSWQSGSGGADHWRLGLEVGLKLVLALGAVVVLMRWVLPRLVHLLARSQELLLLFALAWGTALAAGGDMLGFIALPGDTDATAFAKRGVDHVFRPDDDAADFAAREIGQALTRQSLGSRGAPDA